jgi:predicted MFS family arabinose efflux permease
LQTPAGFLVDRIGARPVLFGGLGLLAVATVGYGLSPSYETMLVVAFLAGAGNSVFHPADYSLINGAVSVGRTGRAYSVHGVGGHIGFAIAWPIMLPLGALFGWRNAAIGVGLFGIAATLALIAMRDSLKPHETIAAKHRPAESMRRSVTMLLSPQFVTYFLFFFTFAFAIIGLQSFSPPALAKLTGLPFEFTSAILTTFLIGTPVGILIGGVVADSFPRHVLVAAGGFAMAGLFVVAVPLVSWPVPLLFVLFGGAGLMLGIALPSRDMVVRSATPPSASGKVFGFVYSGLDTGASLGPIVLGWLLDHGRPGWLFYTAALLMFLGAMLIRIPASLFVRRTRAETRA